MKNLISYEDFVKKNKEKYQKIIEKEKIRVHRTTLFNKDGSLMTLDSMLKEDYEKEIFFFQNIFKGNIVRN